MSNPLDSKSWIVCRSHAEAPAARRSLAPRSAPGHRPLQGTGRLVDCRALPSSQDDGSEVPSPPALLLQLLAAATYERPASAFRFRLMLVRNVCYLTNNAVQGEPDEARTRSTVQPYHAAVVDLLPAGLHRRRDRLIEDSARFCIFCFSHHEVVHGQSSRRRGRNGVAVDLSGPAPTTSEEGTNDKAVSWV
jgi:hypothetical protein